MALLPPSPVHKILSALKADMEDVDYEDLAGIAGMKIRHKRKREPVRGDRPCHTLIFVTDEYVQGETGLTQHEIVRIMKVDLQTDIEIATIESGDDETGVLMLGRAQAAAIARVRQEGSQTMSVADWVVEGDIDPDDRAQAEDGRLTRSLEIQYRVSATDGNVLLASGENA